MKLTFLGKDSTPNDSPTLYATDRDTYLVQGYLVTDPEALAQMRIPEGETVVEMRDLYAAADHGRFRRWLAGEPLDPAAEEEWWRPWREMMRGHREAGRALRRLRVVSEPVTDYIRFEWRDADELVKAGEDVRWLPRQQSSELLLPGNDLWSFDGETVVFTHLSGAGVIQGYELTRDAGLVARCVTAFEAAWRAAIPHDEYTPS